MMRPSALSSAIAAAAFISTANLSCFGLAFSTGVDVRRPRCRARRRRRCIIKSRANESTCPVDESYVVEWKSGGGDKDKGQRFNSKVFASSGCWGRRPYLMRGAFDPDSLLDSCEYDSDDSEENLCAWPSWEDVVEIAADDDSESRIISHVPGDHSSFELRWGPLDDDDANAWLSKASNSNSNNERRETLVVNDIDRFYPPLADWMHDTFSFLPNWRMDDGQISLAENGGGIGPHVDNYDVFLVQMSGQRTWQVGRRKIDAREEMDRMIDGLDVRVLDDWSSNVDERKVEDWTLHPGDVLYLPPRVPHCGTALTANCMTLSVGCRAPSVSDLVSKLAETLSSSIEDYSVRRYTDEDLFADSSSYSPGEITPKAKERARELVMDSLASTIGDDEWWDAFFGRYVTEQKRVRSNYPIPLDDLADAAEDLEDGAEVWSDAKSTVQSVLAGEGVLYHAEGIAFAYSDVPPNDGRATSHRFFVNGEMWQSISESSDAHRNSLAQLFHIVASNRRLDRVTLLDLDDADPSIQQNELASEAMAFLEELVSKGVIYGSEE